jgi:hypothetical protein
MKKFLVKVLVGIVFLTSFLSAQAQVGIGTANPNSSAKLEINSTSQGFLPPRMTSAQKTAIASPAQGLVVFCTDCGSSGELQFFDGTEWRGLVVDIPAPDFLKTVYVNTTSPNTATIFSEDNPPVINDNTLKADVNNIYIGTDGSTWTYKSSTSTYITYQLPVNRVVFKVRCSPFTIIANNTTFVSNWTAPIHNTHPTAWNKSTGEWTAPVKGYYHVSAKISLNGSWTDFDFMNLSILKNGTAAAVGQIRSHTTTSSPMYVTVNTMVYLAVGDKLRFSTLTDGVSPTVSSNSIHNEFNIALQ